MRGRGARRNDRRIRSRSNSANGRTSTREATPVREVEQSRRDGLDSIAQYGIAGAMAYIHTVKKWLRGSPGAYEDFVSAVSQVRQPDADILTIIDRVVMLLETAPDLIYSFNAFLPRNYEIELQEYAVCVKVYDKYGSPTTVVSPGRSASKRITTVPDHSTMNPSDGSMHHNIRYGQSIGYIGSVKKALAGTPKGYQKFMDILTLHHNHETGDIETVRRIVNLLEDYPHLVLGFTSFLPSGYNIKQDNSTYKIQYPDASGRTITVRIKPQD